MIEQLRKRLEVLENAFKRLQILSARAEIAGGFPKTLYADLPSPQANSSRIFYVTNGRKAGEGAGAGTGVYAGETLLSGVPAWVRMDDQTQAVQV